jgi:hypothetical protein
MIRVELLEEIDRRGVFSYRVAGLPIEGRSRQPLLDACRQIRDLLGPTAQKAGLFRNGKKHPDLTCYGTEGAKLTVKEDDIGIRFAKYRPGPDARAEQAARSQAMQAAE